MKTLFKQIIPMFYRPQPVKEPEPETATEPSIDLWAVTRTEYGNFCLRKITKVLEPGHRYLASSLQVGSWPFASQPILWAERNGYQVVNKDADFDNIQPELSLPRCVEIFVNGPVIEFPCQEN